MEKLEPLMTSARTGDSSKDEWCTPKWLFNLLNEEFKFTLDVCATEDNSLCERYFDREIDGLKTPWVGTVWCNPPYSQLKAWMKKGYEEARKCNATVVMLVAARTDTRAWWDYARHGEVRFLKGRLKFEGGKHSAPFPSAIVIFRKYLINPTTIYWEISSNGSK